MFDLSFGKLILVLIIGLIVLGPKRLPMAMKYVMGWVNALRRISASVQLELSQELKLQELKDGLQKIENDHLKQITPEIQSTIDELKRSISQLSSMLEEPAKTATDDVMTSVNKVSNKSLPKEKDDKDGN